MQIKVIFEGDEFKFESNEQETILETLLRNNFDAPFSCQLGFCAVCPVKLVSGEIRVYDDSILTKKERDSNYIVTCQSCPNSNITIQYD